MEHDPKNPLEYAKIWRIAQQAAVAAGKPVKFGTCSAQVLAFFLDSHTPNYDLDDKKQLIWDMAEAMNHELRQLAASGCKVIQVEEPTLHFMARYNPDQKELLDFLVDAFNREVEGLDDVEVWIHTCWGNPNMQKVFSDESYANSMEIYLERLKGDVWTIEATENDFRELSLFAQIPQLTEEEDRRGRHQPSHVAGGLPRRGCRADPALPASTSRPISWCSRPTAVSAGRASIATWRSTRPSASRWHETSSSRNWAWSHATCPRPTKRWPGINCPITSRSPISSRSVSGIATMKRDYSLVGECSLLALQKGLAEANWYTSPVPKETMRELLERRDGPAIRDTIIWFALLIGSGVSAYLLWKAGSWWAVAPFIIYGAIYASSSDSRWHETGHGTAFKTDWMNNALYEIASFMVMRESVPWRWSHTRHHSDTIIVGRDPEIAVPRPPDVLALILGFFNLRAMPKYFRHVLLHCTGRITAEEKTYIPESEYRRVFLRARIYLLIYAAVIGLAVYYRSILPLLYVGLPSIYGAWLMSIYGHPQHAGLEENVLDHRKNCRTVYMNVVHRYSVLEHELPR